MKRAFAALLSLTLAACGVVGDSPRQKASDVPLYYTVGEGGGRGKRLIPYTTLSGFVAFGSDQASKTIKLLAGLQERTPLVRKPVAIGASDAGVFVIDEETQSLYRFNWPKTAGKEGEGDSKATFSRIRTLGDLREPNDLFASVDGTVYISDGKGRKVMQVDRDGRFLKEFTDKENLNQPVSVTVDQRGLRIFVADGLYDRVVVFGPDGRALYGIGERGDGPDNFKHIRGMVQGRNGLLYVVNGLQQKIQAYGLDGTFMGSFGQGAFSSPEGIAVDDDGRLYLVDRLTHRILIFRDGKLVEQYGRHGARPGEFNQPSRLAFHNGMLFVADTGNGRVQVFKVVPENFLSEGGDK